jgi:hydroxymethylpyrimidine/phosphomethylpyrimidine kinase
MLAAVTPRRVPVALSIAGSDSGGGAGIQADVKAFARAGVHGATAITAITVQNTVAVSAVAAVSPEIIVGQIRAVAEDLGVDAVKIGMLGDVATIEAVAGALDELPAGTPVVHDPVMVAESGARLLAEDAVDALRSLVVPRATVITPNLDEARVLAGDETLDGLELARALHALGPRYVVITGGHRGVAGGGRDASGAPRNAAGGGRDASGAPRNAAGASRDASGASRDATGASRDASGGPRGASGDATVDLFFDGEQLTEIAGARHPDGAAHGSGCTHSATLAARLALGDEPLAAARRAREVAAAAVADGLRDLGAGAGPVDVFGLARRR